MARKRLAAIKEFSDLGSGFRVAALDLEIRGAGNLLGGEQSGHIDAVGFEMYMKLLEETIRELKGEEIEDDLRATVNLRVDLKIDDAYIPDMNQRLMVYRKIAAARTERELDAALDEMRDRYGAPPASVLNLAEYGRIRIMADRLGVETIDREGRSSSLSSGRRPRSTRSGWSRWSREWPGATLVPPVSLKLDLEAAAAAKAPQPAAEAGAAEAAGPDDAAGCRQGRPLPAQPPSWWTARATAGEVTAGFTKEEILRQAGGGSPGRGRDVRPARGPAASALVCNILSSKELSHDASD